MDASAAAAFVAAAVAATVGVASPWLQNRGERRRRRHDALTEAMHHANEALSASRRSIEEVTGFWQEGSLSPDHDRVIAGRTAINAAIEPLRVADGRLRTLVPEGHALHETFAEAVRAHEDFRRLVDGWTGSNPFPTSQMLVDRNTVVATERAFYEAGRRELAATG